MSEIKKLSEMSISEIVFQATGKSITINEDVKDDCREKLIIIQNEISRLENENRRLEGVLENIQK